MNASPGASRVTRIFSGRTATADVIAGAEPRVGIATRNRVSPESAASSQLECQPPLTARLEQVDLAHEIATKREAGCS